MSLQSVATKFVDLCNQGKNFDVMKSLYAPSIVSVEADGSETSGQQPVIHKSETWQDENEIKSERVRGPYYNGKNQFAVHYTFEVTRKDSGKKVTLEEVGVYTVEKDKITREVFYYDGEH
jgi:SnoaL-like protein